MLAACRDQLRAQQMQLEVTAGGQGAHHQARYDVAYGARPAAPRHPEHDRGRPRRAASCSERYEPGSTIVVDTRPGSGLDIHAASRDPSKP
jgi:hypothetical protein